ncbi:MAG: hypothetical protein RLZZ362_281 [Actinomycetota bacterium]
MRRAAWALVVGFGVVAGSGMVACSGGAGEVAPVSLESVVPPLPSAATSPSTTGAATTSVATPDTVQPDTTRPSTTSPELTGPVFSDALGVKVATAPGVNTPGDTRQLLPEGLYVHIAWTADPTDPSVFTVQPDDIPILEAYANAVTTFYGAALTNVITDDPGFDEFFLDGGAKFDDAFARHREAQEVLRIGTGVVLRPYVLSDQTSATTAVVLDCTLGDSGYTVGVPLEANGMKPDGTVATLSLVGGKWLIDKVSNEARACV